MIQMFNWISRTIGSKRKETLNLDKRCSPLIAAHYDSVWSHVCMDALRASPPYHNLTSDSCLVLWPYVCSPFRHSLIRISAVSSESSSLSKLLFRVFLQPPLSRFSPSFTLFHTLNFSRVNKTIWHFRLCWGPVGPNLPAETLRAQRHPMVHSAAASPIGLIKERMLSSDLGGN